MAQDEEKQVEDLLEQARGIPPTGRAEFLDKACGSDVELRRQIDSQLQHCSQRFWTAEPTEASAPLERRTSDQSTPRPGTRIGAYVIRQQLGEGGFAVVFVADQVVPFCRRVAIKLMKPGTDTKEIIARFEQERQALALMDHPNVAQVFDGGSTENGQPYFVMEYVPGLPMTDYCDQQRLTTKERLQLFVQACDGIQHAHQKGIIHRDVKPSNVLVADRSNERYVKVIDFGIARAIGPALVDATIFTRRGQLIGTPEYMSPEQAEMNWA